VETAGEAENFQQFFNNEYVSEGEQFLKKLSDWKETSREPPVPNNRQGIRYKQKTTVPHPPTHSTHAHTFFSIFIPTTQVAYLSSKYGEQEQDTTTTKIRHEGKQTKNNCSHVTMQV
jgi:hypothetical protein